jgi:uncharacterized membrane protein required for colicin V production
MNLIDVIAIVIVLAYGVLGFMTGAIRRVLGLVIVYVATLVGTYMGPHGADIYRQYSPATAIPDARLLGWLFFLALMIVVLEGVATALHENLQASVVALNEGVGVVLGVAAGLILVVVITFMLAGYAQPSGGGQLSSTELSVKDQLNGSVVAVPLTKRIGAPIVVAFSAALPREASQFFVVKTI